ncbi:MULTISPECIES: crossover junction endodeoxyribonuclease RuvC [unclassified Spirosoma]|uniref:crossover junction endodeoxyribonuclease RuvC n=1 Tax=unclassified Spirosoma TaxID=2621999 RepID=UPI00095F41BF|nr:MULTISPECIES: crossover junction endodeoxyribonuclease RuvC [unclassified Spirosoma]OJW71733.1 MAG: crossover junction endodeoxyribonuclease RuvC [Spirosoma sp. 48-14]
MSTTANSAIPSKQVSPESSPSEKIILGVDPGTQVAGYGIISVAGGNMTMIQYGVVQLSKYSTYQLKLQKLYETILRLIDEYHPDEMAIEDPFFGKNVQAMLKLGRAQGVVMAAALSRNIPIVEYAPRRIKQSVTGNGNATKDQVAHMVGHLLNQQLDPQFFDATDALAIAVCHHFHANALPLVSNKKTKKGAWGAFVSENSNRVL